MRNTTDDLNSIERLYVRALSKVGYQPGKREAQGFVLGFIFAATSAIAWVFYKAPWAASRRGIISETANWLLGQSSRSGWATAFLQALVIFAVILTTLSTVGWVSDYLNSKDSDGD